MGISKRIKEERKRWLENERLNPTPIPPDPPWTNHDLAAMDQMESILNRLKYQSGENIELASELIQFGYLFRYSQRMSTIKSKVAHYKTLSQSAAKEKVWKKIYDCFFGLDTELHLLRNSRQRGGTNVQ